MTGELEGNGLLSLQRATLERAADSTGRYLDLMYYHAARRDVTALESLARRGVCGHGEDRLACLLLRADVVPPQRDTLLALTSEVQDPWVIYTLVKYLLRQDEISPALSVVVETLKRGSGDTVALNTIALHALFRGHAAVARRVANLSMERAPGQRDMEVFLGVLDDNPVPVRRPCLELLPPTYRVDYYLPCYNVGPHIERTLSAIVASCYPLSAILVVDDGSSDDSAAIAQRFPVRLITHGVNKGLAAARNTAWRHSDAEFIATVDTDASPEPGYLRYALMEFEQGPQTLALTGGRLLEAYSDTPVDRWRCLNMSQDPGMERWYVDKMEAIPEEEAGRSLNVNDGVPFLTGSNTLARRSALEGVGGYNERHRTNAEDLAMCRSLLESGLHYVFSPHCVATHYRRDTLASVLRTAWNYGFWERVDAGFYRDVAGLLTLLDDHHVASQHFIMQTIERQQNDLLYIEFLYMYNSALLDLRHGVELGLLTAGQMKTVQNALDALVGALDLRFGGHMLSQVVEDLGYLRVKEDISDRPLAPADAQELQRLLALFQQDHQTYSQALYDLLCASSEGLTGS